MEEKMKLTIEIRNRQPIQLMDLAQSMMSIGSEYEAYVARYDRGDPSSTKLYVKEVRSGSVITELVALAPYALPFIEHGESVLAYGEFLGKAYDWLLGRGNKPDERLDRQNLANLHTILEPVAKDNGSQLFLQGSTFNGNVVFNFGVDSTEANAAQNTIRKQWALEKETITGVHRDVVMYWAQARNDPKGKSGDKARIESLYNGDVKVRFASDELKTHMLLSTPFPFTKAFVVDVAVETINGRPVLYKVLAVNDILDAE